MRPILIALLLILGIPVKADVGDAYFCNTTSIVYFDQKKQRVLVDKKSRPFKFKWVEKYGEQRAVFDEKFIIKNQTIIIESNGESSFRGVGTYTAGLLWFDATRLKWTSFAWNEDFNDHTLWASCSKF